MYLMYILVEHLNTHSLPTICWKFVILQHGPKGSNVDMDPLIVISHEVYLEGGGNSK